MQIFILFIFLFSFLFFYIVNDLLNNCWELLYSNLDYFFSLKTDYSNITEKELELDSLITKQFQRLYSFSNNQNKNLLKLFLMLNKAFLSKKEEILQAQKFSENYDFFLKNLSKEVDTLLLKFFLKRKESFYNRNENIDENFEDIEKEVELQNPIEFKNEEFTEQLNDQFSEESNDEFSNQISLDDPNFSDFFSLDKGELEVLEDTGVKFSDIAGNDSAKKEIQQIVDFLKTPENFTKLGAEIPKGVLLGGPPGTGKTLFAKAIAGEAGKPFLKVSGSEFVELFVGLGAARVRELFEKARALQPCIIFIDEIDSIAKSRASFDDISFGNEERDQTLNQLLVEMDGFEPSTGIIVIGASNRTDILDPAIKRPGRFDRQIMLSYPNLAARESILKIHGRNKKIAESVSIIEIAQKTAGFSGADLENLLNEAAILATRRKKTVITADDINDSLEKIVNLGVSGLETSRMKLKLIKAFPEIAYSYIVQTFSEDVSLDRITLISRDKKKLNASSKVLPNTISQFQTKFSLLVQLLILLSRYSSEKIVFGESEITTDRRNELSNITRITQVLGSEYGMANLQLLNLDPDLVSEQDMFMSDETRNLSDNYSLNLINSLLFFGIYYTKALMIGEEKLVDELLRYEQLDKVYFEYLANQYYSFPRKKDILIELRKSLISKILLKLNLIKKSPKQDEKR